IARQLQRARRASHRRPPPHSSNAVARPQAPTTYIIRWGPFWRVSNPLSRALQKYAGREYGRHLTRALPWWERAETLAYCSPGRFITHTIYHRVVMRRARGRRGLTPPARRWTFAPQELYCIPLHWRYRSELQGKTSTRRRTTAHQAPTTQGQSSAHRPPRTART